MDRVLTVLHCDIIQENFYTDVCPGIIPFISWAQQKKKEKEHEKERKKEKYKLDKHNTQDGGGK